MSTSPVRVEPLAVSVSFADTESLLVVGLADGRQISVPVVWFPRLRDASTEERADYVLIGGGIGIHWPRIDEDLSVAGLLRGDH
jgi:Protein of unknown function (DUF2442)